MNEPQRADREHPEARAEVRLGRTNLPIWAGLYAALATLAYAASVGPAMLAMQLLGLWGTPAEPVFVAFYAPLQWFWIATGTGPFFMKYISLWFVFS
ncbi:hypothetical protein [Planctomicrobium piriforme]|uniref:Uncharacterized protein n=1 Tax=Planctomicrobium piriforme TaxID=1576369 RepID=A0A1I3HSU3_9PLAN|nr:hypothetical protein [Planctomicrobium piriforme]SFI38838.1 hypothetical protein SAMN05421753_108182 [Planctomicrobium piriforme]